ncbi:MAG: hypothetical protein AB8B84_13955 [Granulosicoccus sp.]
MAEKVMGREYTVGKTYVNSYFEKKALMRGVPQSRRCAKTAEKKVNKSVADSCICAVKM